MHMPEEEKYLQTEAELHDMLVGILGGRAAEELVFDTVTTGAANDIEKATGFTRGTIFHYADTKLDLFRQVVEYYVLERQDIDRKIQVADDCTLRQFIDTYVKGVELTMETLHEIIGMDVPMRDCSRAYLNIDFHKQSAQ